MDFVVLYIKTFFCNRFFNLYYVYCVIFMYTVPFSICVISFFLLFFAYFQRTVTRVSLFRLALCYDVIYRYDT